MAVIARASGPPGRSCAELSFGTVSSAIPLSAVGIEALRRESQHLHPDRPLSDELDRTATHVAGVLSLGCRSKIVATARLTQFGPNSFFPQIYGGPLPSGMSGEKTVELSWVVVGERYRGRRIGKWLVVQVMDLAYRKGCHMLVGVLQVGMPRGVPCPDEVQSELAIVRSMYEKLGFKIHDEVSPRPALDSGVPLVPFSYDLTEGPPPLAFWQVLGTDDPRVSLIPGTDALTVGFPTPLATRRGA